MKRVLVALMALVAAPVLGQVHQAQYGVSGKFPFKLYAADGTLDVDESDGGTDVTIMCDEGTPATATNDYVDEGTSYSITLTAAEMSCARIEVHVSATVDNAFFIETFGDLRAQDKTRGIASGVAQSGDTTEIVLAASTSFADDFLKNRLVCILGGTGAGQCQIITAYDGDEDTATVTGWGTAPDNTSVYVVYASAQATQAELIAAMDDSGIATLSDVQGELNNLRSDLSGGSTPVTIGTDGLTANSISTEAGEEIAAAVGSLQVEDQDGGYDLSCAIATLLAYAAGEMDTEDGTTTYQDPGGNESRLVGTVSGSSRGSITITCP